MNYLDYDYVKDRIPSEILNLTTNDSTTQDNITLIEEIINECEAIAESYIIKSGYNVTTTRTLKPPFLISIIFKLVKYEIFSRKTIDEDVLKRLWADNEKALGFLREIRSGHLDLFDMNANRSSYSETDGDGTPSFFKDLRYQ